MKTLPELNVLVVDYGAFIPLAQKFAEQAASTWIYTPYEDEYLKLQTCCRADGLPKLERADDFLDPDFLTGIDLAVFPDRGFSSAQALLRSRGIKVWGSFYACHLEEYRTKFLKVIKKLGLQVKPYVVVKGLTDLSEHLKEVENKWVKINRFRHDMETWHHTDWMHSRPMLQRLALAFGPLQDEVTFVVQDPIDGTDDEPVLEIGYDGWNIDGQFPSRSFQGYEKKNELYLGSVRAWDDLPEAVRAVNEAMAPILRDYGYRNFWATEIRQIGDDFYFIDPTPRMPQLTAEHLLEDCSNLCEVIWEGANGNVIEPEFTNDYAAEVTIHYTAGAAEDWKSIKVPPSLKRWFKPYYCCACDGAQHFPPHRVDEVGALIGLGDSVEEAVADLKSHLDDFKDEPVSGKMDGFIDLIQQIEAAEKAGLEFTDQELPKPTELLEEML